jgi:hypothetical protein
VPIRRRYLLTKKFRYIVRVPHKGYDYEVGKKLTEKELRTRSLDSALGRAYWTPENEKLIPEL